MTRQEEIEELERLLLHWDDLENGKRVFRFYEKDALQIALSALRPVSREQVEKVWRGGWVPYLDGEHIMPERYYRCSKCGDRGYMRKRNFCPNCGAPMTDEAVEMVMRRLEVLHDKDV